MTYRNAQELFSLWLKDARGDKLTLEEDKALVEGIVRSPELRELIKEWQKGRD